MTNKNALFLVALLGLSLAGPSCAIEDADLESSGLLELTVTSSATEVDVLQVDITGAATLAYTSQDDAGVEIFVNGLSVFSDSLDASAGLELDFAATLPLSVGSNQVITELSYNGALLTDSFVVDVTAPAPAATFPSWNTDFTQSGNVTIDMNPAWSVDEVTYSVAQGEFLPASDNGDGSYQLDLENLDIGDSALTLRVLTSNGGFQQEHLFHDLVEGIVPVFDCAQASSMVPNTDLLRDNRTENRTMLGYFGDPDSEHIITFVVEFVDDQGDRFVNPAEVLSRGRTAIDVALQVDQFRCNNNPCSSTYDLALFVDGVQHCRENNFGDIFEL